MSESASKRIHGGVDSQELATLGIDATHLLDLSVNITPLGTHPYVVQAVQHCSLRDYPDPRGAQAKATIAAAVGAHPHNIVLGNGSAELLWTMVTSLAARDQPLLVVGPTFSEPEAAAIAYGLPVVHACMSEATAFEVDADAISSAIARHKPGVVYLCHPNNPTGRALPLATLRALLAAHRSTIFILDQAFLSLSFRHEEAGQRFGDHVVLVRSLTKDHALAGLRVAYAICHPDLAARFDARRPTWTTSSLAQAAMIAAIAQPEHVDRARGLLLDAAKALRELLMSLGLDVVPSEAPFLLIRVGDADDLRQRLLARHRILVRSCASFGLPEHIRLLGCNAEARARLAVALAEGLSR